MLSGGCITSGAVFLGEFTAVARRTLLVRPHRASQSPVGRCFSAALLCDAAGGGRGVWQPVEDPSSFGQLRGIRHVILRPTHHGKDVGRGDHELVRPQHFRHCVLLFSSHGLTSSVITAPLVVPCMRLFLTISLLVNLQSTVTLSSRSPQSLFLVAAL